MTAGEFDTRRRQWTGGSGQVAVDRRQFAPGNVRSQAKGPGSVNRLAALLSGSGMSGTDGGMNGGMNCQAYRQGNHWVFQVGFKSGFIK